MQGNTAIDQRGRAYSVERAAQILGLGRTTFYSLIREGRIKTFKIRSRRLVSDDAIAAFIRDAEQAA